MKIYINHQEQTVESNITLRELLLHENIPQAGTAVAINNSVVRATEWATTHLNQEDKVMIIRASKGG